MAYYYYYSYILSAFLALILTLQILSASPKLSLRLIHRRSILPHHYSPDVDDDDMIAPVTAKEDRTVFMVNISIGEPPVPQLLVMDTGSSLVWVRCSPCHKCNNIFFKFARSSTFSRLPRNAPQCSSFRPQFLDHPFCYYNIKYTDESASTGELVLEKFTFATSTGGTAHVSDAVLGCSFASSPDDLPGILGLEAPSKYHLVARIGNKFSYCIGNISDISYMHNVLILGDGAIIQGDFTPLRINEYGRYMVSLEGISVGETQLAINQQHDVHVDSGTTRTYLVKEVYEPLVAEIMNLIDGVLRPARDKHAENAPCYLGDMERDLKGFPVVTLHLAEGADMDLDFEAVFQRSGDGRSSAFCVAIVESSENVIGVMAQQYYNVGFDLEAERISFQRIDCELLQD